MVEESKSKWAKSESEVSISDSDLQHIKCLMTDVDLETNNNKVFDFTYDEFTRDDLFTSLNEMVIDYKRLSQTFENSKQKTTVQ